MGVDTGVWLPPDVDLDDVLDTIGRLLGVKPKDYGTFRSFHGLFKVRCYVDTGDVIDIEVPDELHRFDDLGFNPMWFWCSYYHDGKRFIDGCNHLSASSSPVRVALFRRLAQIFGGVFTPNDCQQPENLIKYPRPRKGFRWSQRYDDEDFNKYQAYLESVQPITDAEIEAARKDAAWADAKW